MGERKCGEMMKDYPIHREKATKTLQVMCELYRELADSMDEYGRSDDLLEALDAAIFQLGCFICPSVSFCAEDSVSEGKKKDKIFGLPWKNADGISGKIQFRLVRQYQTDKGSTCYVIHVFEVWGENKIGLLIQEYSGFYNRQKDVFVLYPRKYRNTSFLDYPFERHEVNPYWVVNFTYSVMREVDENTNLDDIF